VGKYRRKIYWKAFAAGHALVVIGELRPGSRLRVEPVYTCAQMIAFEWDPRKAAANTRKHGIQFADAVLVLEDERAITLRDDAQNEERWLTIGMDALARRQLWIISARTATPNELAHYTET
jgi:uncharacterized protein